MLRSFLSSHSNNLSCEVQCCMLYRRLLTCKVESFMIKLNVEYVENETYRLMLNVCLIMYPEHLTPFPARGEGILSS